jgi:hypothetical protein
MNLTVPVGVPDPGETTASVAVNVIWAPLVVTARVVVTWAWLTVTVPPFTVELEKLLSPEYCTAMRFAPGGREDVVKVATPLARVTGLPSGTPLLKN